MKKLLLFPCALLLLAGCASYYQDQSAVASPNGDIVYEPAGAMVDPNPNWDVNARDIRQRPFGLGGYIPWTATGTTAVHTSTDADKNIGPHIRTERDLP